MVKACVVYFCLSVVGILLTLPKVDSANSKCTTLDDCECGYQCIDTERMTRCSDSSSCRCRKGCAVGNMFIRPGKLWQEAYCNLCSCHMDPVINNGIPTCTRSRWCGIPDDIPLYSNNQNCNVERKS